MWRFFRAGSRTSALGYRRGRGRACGRALLRRIYRAVSLCGGEWGAVGVIIGAFYYVAVLANYTANVALIVFYIAVNCIVFNVALWGQNAVNDAVAEDIVANISKLVF